MPVVYLKRHRMQIDLRHVHFDLPDSPNDRSGPKKEHRGQNASGEIVYLPWGDKLINLHSLAKWESFRFEIDASVFPCLGDREGCKQLMRDLSQRANFVPEATWLAMGQQSDGFETPAGTIQAWRYPKHWRRACLSRTRDRSIPASPGTAGISRFRLHGGPVGGHRPQPGRDPTLRVPRFPLH